MLDDDSTTPETPTEAPPRTRRRAAGRPAGPPAAPSTDIFAAPATEPPAKKAAKKSTAKKATVKKAASTTGPDAEKAPAPDSPPEQSAPTAAREKAEGDAPAEDAAPVKKATRSRARKTAAPDGDQPAAPAAAVPAFQAPETTVLPPRARKSADASPADDADRSSSSDDSSSDDGDDSTGDREGGGSKRRRRSRGGRRRNKAEDGADSGDDSGSQDEGSDAEDDSGDGGEGGGTRRRRRRGRSGDGGGRSGDGDGGDSGRGREGRSAEDEITGVAGSTRLEAKKQRRREGREAGRRRAPIVSEAEFLARRESVDRQMVVRQHTGAASAAGDENAYTQIAVLEDSVLVEHYVARESQISIIGNVYLGKVQNVLPSMEAAFVDIGAGRNAVIYAGEVDWSQVPNGKARKIEDALSPGQIVTVQVTKDPIGQKGARLTSQISLPGRFLVYVPGGQSNGISRKLPDTERARLKALLKEVLPENAGVIVRTAAEGASEDQLTRDVAALKARWEDIETKIEQGKGPQLLYAEPDLVIKVVRDLFNEDFASLVVEGPDAWDNISGYIKHVAPELAERLSEWRPEDNDGQGSFEALRLDEQIHKALERKVWLPSGGSLVIDRTEAMTVVDVNTGKFTGSGGNLEETVTKNNLEAAEEIVRQLRLRDIGGIIVIDFIDMVLESNRDLVLRRLVECLGRDRTRHQVAEVTSLGLVQMTRKRIGTGLLESFSADCQECNGRGVVITAEPVEPRKDDGGNRRGGRRGGGNGGNGGGGNGGGGRGGSGGSGNGGGGNGSGNGGGGNGGSGNGGGGRGGNREPRKPDTEQPADGTPAPTTGSDPKPASVDPDAPKDAPATSTEEVTAAPADSSVPTEVPETPTTDDAGAGTSSEQPAAESTPEPAPETAPRGGRQRGRRGASRPAGGTAPVPAQDAPASESPAGEQGALPLTDEGAQDASTPPRRRLPAPPRWAPTRPTTSSAPAPF